VRKSQESKCCKKGKGEEREITINMQKNVFNIFCESIEVSYEKGKGEGISFPLEIVKWQCPYLMVMGQTPH